MLVTMNQSHVRVWYAHLIFLLQLQPCAWTCLHASHARCLWNVQVSMYIHVLQSFFVGVRTELGFIFGRTTPNRKGFRFSNALPVDIVILTAFAVCFKHE